MLGVKSFDPCREFGCYQSLFFIVVDHCVPFTLAVVKSQVVLQSPFVERFHCSNFISMSVIMYIYIAIYHIAIVVIIVKYSWVHFILAYYILSLTNLQKGFLNSSNHRMKDLPQWKVTSESSYAISLQESKYLPHGWPL